MRPASHHSRSVQLDEVGYVRGHDRAARLRGLAQQRSIRPIRADEEIPRRYHVVTALPQLASNLRREMLIQDEPHRRIARSRRAAASSRSATAACVANHWSISSGNEA